MKIRNILRYIGTSLLMVSALMLVSGLISLYYGGDDSMMPLFYSALITATVGGFPFLFTSRVVRLSVKEGYFVVVGAWLCGSLFGMLPFLWRILLCQLLFRDGFGFYYDGRVHTQ